MLIQNSFRSSFSCTLRRSSVTRSTRADPSKWRVRTVRPTWTESGSICGAMSGGLLSFMLSLINARSASKRGYGRPSQRAMSGCSSHKAASSPERPASRAGGRRVARAEWLAVKRHWLSCCFPWSKREAFGETALGAQCSSNEPFVPTGASLVFLCTDEKQGQQGRRKQTAIPERDAPSSRNAHALNRLDSCNLVHCNSFPSQ